MNKFFEISNQQLKQLATLGFIIVIGLIFSFFVQQSMGVFDAYKRFKRSVKSYEWLKNRILILEEQKTYEVFQGENFSKKIEVFKDKNEVENLKWNLKEESLFISFEIESLEVLKAVTQSLFNLLNMENSSFKLEFGKTIKVELKFVK